MSTYKYLDDNGLIYYHSKIKTLLNGKVDKESGKGLSTNDYTTAEKNKLSGVATGAEVNQNAFSNIKVGNSTIASDSKTDTLELIASTGIVLTPDTTNDTVTIACNAEVPTKTSDLTNDSGFLIKTDYGTSSDGGTVKGNLNGFAISSQTGDPSATTYTYADYTNCLDKVFIGKGTLENVITGKSLVSKTDYASSSTGGVVRISPTYKIAINNDGTLYVDNVTYSNYNSASNLIFISKGTLETVITGKNLETANNKVTSISSSSTDTQYASAKCVYDSIQDAIGSVTGLNFEVVQSLPQTGTAGTIYLVPNSGTSPNAYDEYVWLTSSSSFEKIGTTDVDLSGYVQTSDMVRITNAEIDTIVA